MPQLKLKSTVTKRDVAVTPDLRVRLEELQQRQAEATAEPVAEVTAPVAEVTAEPVKAKPPGHVDPIAEVTAEPPKSGKQLTREANALQWGFLSANRHRVVTVYTLNGVKLVGRLLQFDQYTLLLQGPDGADSLIFKHAVTSIKRQTDQPTEPVEQTD